MGKKVWPDYSIFIDDFCRTQMRIFLECRYNRNRFVESQLLEIPYVTGNARFYYD